jgi:tRNA (cmo5U34)-methyltransferase
MPQDFKDKTTAQAWDSDTSYYNPTRPEQLDLMLTILEDHFQPGDTILDLGFGSGLVEALIFERISGARVVGVDASEAMMALAHERLAPYAAQYTTIQHDLRELSALAVERGSFPFIISIQALHHLTDAEMQSAYGAVYDLLKPGGLFLLLDRMAIQPPDLFSLYQSVWRYQDEHYQSRVKGHEGDTYAAYLEQLADRADIPLSLERHLELMKDAGLSAACLDARGIRVLLAARK